MSLESILLDRAARLARILFLVPVTMAFPRPLR